MAMRRAARPLMALGFLSLVLGIWSGLVRVGWPWPSLTQAFWLAHGPLMVSGFVGTLIALERAVALERPWGYAAPALSAAGALVMVADALSWLGPALILLGSLILVALFTAMLFRQSTPAASVMLLGAMAWALGNLLWLASYPSLAIDRIVLWWMGFLVLLIAGERLELSRVLRPSRRTVVAFLLLADAFLIGAVWTSFGVDAGNGLAGAALIGLAAWLLRHDLARVQIRSRGSSRFIAAALLAGYAWLGIGGLLVAASWASPVPLGYDAMLHAVFLGFVISMIFAHAPIIFPAVLGAPLPYRRWYYGHLVALHAGLLLRVAGDLAVSQPVREWGALLNGAALAWFLVDTGLGAWLGRHEARSAST